MEIPMMLANHWGFTRITWIFPDLSEWGKDASSRLAIVECFVNGTRIEFGAHGGPKSFTKQ
jgi:hypothetical protein